MNNYPGKNVRVTNDLRLAGYTEMTVFGYKTVGTSGTAEQLGTETPEHFVKIKAMEDNTGNIYIGDSSVSATNGYPIVAGEELELPVTDLSTIYLDTDTGGEGVKYIGV